MGRYQTSVVSKYEGEELEQIIKDCLTSNKYEAREYKGEANVSRYGVGFLTAPKYIKYTIEGNRVDLEAWIRIYCMFDSGISGAVGVVPKQSLKKTLELLIHTIE